MKTTKRILLLLVCSIVSHGLIHAQDEVGKESQEKQSNKELLQKNRELLQKNREIFQKWEKQQEEQKQQGQQKQKKQQKQQKESKAPQQKPVVLPLPKADEPTVAPVFKPIKESTDTRKTDVPALKPVTKPADTPKTDSKWSLEECIQYAIDHNIGVKQLYLQREEAAIQQNTAKNSRLPNLNAAMKQEWNFGRSENLFTGEFEDRNQAGSVVNAQSVVPLFTGFRIPNRIAHTKLEYEVVTQNLEKAKEDLSLNITSMFLQVLLFKELYNINRQQFEFSKAQVQRTKFLVQSGSVPKSQLSDIEAQVAKDNTAVVDAQNNLELSLLDLAQSLELEQNTDFDIQVPEFSGDIIAKFMNSLQAPALIYENALNFKPTIKGQELKVESSRKKLKIAESEYYPQLDLSLGTGTRYYHIYNPPEQTNPITNRQIEYNLPFDKQIRNYGNWLISLNLNIPIFNRFQVRNQVRSARVDILNQQLVLENNKKILYKEIQTAYKNAVAAREKYKASEQALTAASESFEQSKKRYEFGKATVFEFDEAKTRYIQIQSEQIQAKYEYILRTKILDFYNGIEIRL